MARMVQVAVAGDVAEAEEMQAILRNVGIESELDAQGPWTFAKLMLVSAELNALAGALH